MPGILIPHVLRQQPPVATPLKYSGVGKGLFAVYSGSPINLVDGVRASITGTIKTEASLEGVCLRNSGSTTSYLTTKTPPASVYYSVLCVFTPYQIATANVLLDGDDNVPSNTARDFQFGNITNAVNFIGFNTSNTSYQAITGSVVQANKPVTAIGVYNNTNLSVYAKCNGAISYGTATIIGTPRGVGASSHEFLCRSASHAASPSGSNVGASLLAEWNRALTAGEVSALLDNPWDIFVPRRSIMYFDVSSSTIPTLSSPGVTNILTTSATPQVSLTF